MNDNPDNERRRLAELYSSMSDGELQKLADEAAELSDVARAALAAEAARRGLPLFLNERNDLITDFRPLLTIRQFRDLPVALLAKSALEAAGIECHLADDNMVRTDWFISNVLGGVKLNVRPEDVIEAEQVLENPVPEGLAVEGVGEFHQPHCPTCGSDDVAFEAVNKKLFLVPAYFLFPIPIPRNSWKCYECGATWDETKLPERPSAEGN